MKIIRRKRLSIRHWLINNLPAIVSHRLHVDHAGASNVIFDHEEESRVALLAGNNRMGQRIIHALQKIEGIHAAIGAWVDPLKWKAKHVPKHFLYISTLVRAAKY